MRNRFGEWVTSAARKNKKIILLSGDIGYGIFDDFIKEHPKKFINCGISEQNMIGVAAGLAANGYLPIVYTIIPFLIYRPYEFIRNLIAYQNLPVTLVGVGGGFSYDTLGHTHYGLEDLNLMLSLPNFSIGIPFDPSSVEICMEQVLNQNGPYYIRLMKGGEEDLAIEKKLNVSNSEFCVSYYGNDFTILTHGGLVHEALAATHVLKYDHGINGSVVTVFNTCYSNLSEICHGDIFIYEENVFPGIYGKFLLFSNIKQVIKKITYVNSEILNNLDNRAGILDNQKMSSRAMILDILTQRKIKKNV